jgi:hypothetical protein
MRSSRKSTAGLSQAAVVRIVPLLPALKVLSLKEVAFSWRVFFVDLMPSRIWFATAMDMPQKSGTRCTHAA